MTPPRVLRLARPQSSRRRRAALALTVGVVVAGSGTTAAAAGPDPAATATEATATPDPATPERVEGGDRVETALAVARDRYSDGEGAVVLASAEDFADALAGAALADHVKGPMLLTGGDELDERVATELAERLAPGAVVWLLGGPLALSTEVEDAVHGLGFSTERLHGRDRYGTAAAIVRTVVGDATDGCELLVATGTTFADGVSASGLASAATPLLFTQGEHVPRATAEVLAACAQAVDGARVTAVGGAAAGALDDVEVNGGLVVTEVVGEDRYETSARLLALARGADPLGEAVVRVEGRVTLTSGLDHPDALIGGTYGDPVLLTRPDQLPGSVVEALRATRTSVDGVLVVGGSQSVSERAARDAASLADDAAAPVPPEASADDAAAGPPREDDEPAPTAMPVAPPRPESSEPDPSPEPSASERPEPEPVRSPSTTGTADPEDSVTATTPTGPPPAGGHGLTWAPPQLTDPTTVTLSSSRTVVTLDDREDYVIRIQGGRVDRPVSIHGGNDVVWIGGEVDAAGSERAVLLEGQTGTVHVEGIRITGEGLKEGINLSQPDAVVQLQNIRIDQVVGSYDGHHADLVQSWNGPRVLRVDRLEGSTGYQGFFFDPGKFGDSPPVEHDLRNVVIRGDRARSAYLLWQSGEFPIKTSNVVLVHPTKGKDRLVRTVRGQRSWDGVRVATAASSPLTGAPGRDYAGVARR